MTTRITPAIALLVALLLTLIACTSTPQQTLLPTPTSSSYPWHLTEEIPPCTPVAGSSVDPCEPDAERIEGSIAAYLPDLGDEPLSIREMLDDSPLAAWVTHLALRGTYLPGTARCTAGDPYRPLPHLAEEWDERSFKCYIDMRANAYILGTGPPTLTVLMFVDYVYSAAAEVGIVEEYIQDLETLFEDAFPGIEHVVFLGPSDDLSSEAWRLFGYWDVQQKEDGAVLAVNRQGH